MSLKLPFFLGLRKIGEMNSPGVCVHCSTTPMLSSLFISTFRKVSSCSPNLDWLGLLLVGGWEAKGIQ